MARSQRKQAEPGAGDAADEQEEGAAEQDGSARTGSRSAEADAESAAAEMRRGGKGARRMGHLIVIGGGEERSADGAILRHVVQAAGGERARIVVCAGASSEPEEPLEDYRRIFTELGVAEVTTEPLRERAAA